MTKIKTRLKRRNEGKMRKYVSKYLGIFILLVGVLLYKLGDIASWHGLAMTGLLLLVSFFGAPKGGYVPPPSLPWLISALTIIGVALHEENMMVKKHGEKYVRYRDNTPLMVPLPKQLSALIVAPARALLKKNWPENGKEIAFIIIVYGVMLVLLSLPLILFFPV